MLAVSSGSLGLVVLLLEAGSDINAQDKVNGMRYASTIQIQLVIAVVVAYVCIPVCSLISLSSIDANLLKNLHRTRLLQQSVPNISKRSSSMTIGLKIYANLLKKLHRLL